MIANPLLLYPAQTANGDAAVLPDAKTMINKNIYGHFAEHLGHCIYDGIYVGDTNKIIPNTAGVRNDIIAALIKLKVPVFAGQADVLQIPIIGRMG